MRPSDAVAQHRNALLEIARRYGVSNVRVFGSVARGEDGEGSDVDLLVDAPRGTTYFTLARIQDEAERLTGFSVDIHTPEGLKARIRSEVLAQARPL